ncbi:MAG: immunoglobulin domain-containing protein [Terracidiphilus sp.]
MRNGLVVSSTLVSIALMLAGCSSAPGTAANPTVEPVITSQPAPQNTPLGQTATFSVVASGTAPLSYQWSENGAPIAGATQASYVTPPVQSTSSGEKFTVTVSNSAGSVDSNSAALTVGPRSPKAGDLRFQQVDAPSVAFGNLGGYAMNLSPGQQSAWTNMIGTPFELGPGICSPGVQYSCGWFYATFFLPANVSGLNVTYQSDPMGKFASDLAAYSAPNVVINSLDEETANDIFALEATSTQQATGFAMTHSSVPLSGLQGLATQLGTLSQVVTAVSFDAVGQVDVLSYSWQGDPSTPYDAVVSPVTIDTVGVAAQQMARDGYIITAFGGTSTSGFILVGTKVQGDSMPRPTIVSPNMSTPGKGFAPVAMPTDWGTADYAPYWIFQQ